MFFPWRRFPSRRALSTARPFGRRASIRPCRLNLEAFEDRLPLSTFLVTNTQDSGTGSLRQAILEANSNPGLNTIAFDIGGGGVQTIQPTSALPEVTNPVVIDGTTQPGFNGHPLIVLNGSQAGVGVDGLTISAGKSTVKDLVIDGFRSSGASLGNGIVLMTNGGNRIAGNYIGTDVTGTIAVPNGGQGVLIASGTRNTLGGTAVSDRNVVSGNNSLNFSGGILCKGAFNRIEGNYIGTDVSGTAALGNWSGVFLGGSNNTVGGLTADARNVISGNRSDGVFVDAGDNNSILGNYLGTDVSGTRALGNADSGVEIDQGTGNTVGGTTPAARNLMSGNRYSGVFLNGDVNVVQGNYIGTDVSGTAALGNRFAGVAFNNGNYDLVGGTTAGAGNLISGNEQDGVWILSSRGNHLQGNDIGTDVSGTASLPNGTNGVDLEDANNNFIGGTAPRSGNLISGNLGDGVFIHPEYPTMGGSSGNFVFGNAIGTDVTGTVALGNVGNGVYIGGLCTDNSIGGADAGAGNTIAFNGQDGVLVDSGTANPILQNRSFGNTGLGIELINGGNRMQPFPVVTTSLSQGGPLTVQGFLASAPSTAYLLDFYANTVRNPSGYGEGDQFLGSFTVTTDATGMGHFTASFSVPVPPGAYVAATATDPDGNTSGFSLCDLVTSTPTVLNNHDSGPGSLRQVLAAANDGDTIAFDAALAGQTITLTSGELAIDKSVDIEGPGANQLTISGDNNSRVFDVVRTGVTVTIAGMRMVSGGGLFGGALYIAGGSATLSDSILADNQATYGGGIYLASGTLEIDDCVVSNNAAMSPISSPSVSYRGGGLYIARGSTVVNQSTFAGNRAIGADGAHGLNGHFGGAGGPGGNGGQGAGGGIYVAAGSLTVTESTLSGNQAIGGNGGDGGDSTMSNGGNGGNGGNGVGGGIDIAGGSAVITESTLAGNQTAGGHGGAGGSGNPPGAPGADGPGMGAALANAGTLSITGVTLSTNAVMSVLGGGGGLATLAAGTTSIFNTLIAANTAPSAPDVSGTVDSQGHNLIGDGTGSGGYVGSDLVGTSGNPIDPMLGPLQDNGGPTQTMALLPGSPAIDAGDNTGAPDWDQRGSGFPRIVNGIIDIGAFEYQGSPQAGSVVATAPVQILLPPAPTAIAPTAPVADWSLRAPAVSGALLDPPPAPAAGRWTLGTWLATRLAANRPAEALGPLDASDLDLLALNLLVRPS
jgi:hypothetical protein